MAALRLGICWVARAVLLAVVSGSRNPARLWVAKDTNQGVNSGDVAFHPHVVPPQARFHLKLIFRTSPERANEQRVKFVEHGQSCDAADTPSFAFADAVPECTTATSAEWQVTLNGVSSTSKLNQFDLCYCAEGCSSSTGFTRASGFLQVAPDAPMPIPQPCPRVAPASSNGESQEGTLEDVGLSKQVQGLAAKVQQIQAAQQGAAKQLSKELQDVEGDAGQVGNLKAKVQDAQAEVQAVRSKLEDRVATDAHRVEDFKAILHSVLPSVALKNASTALELKGKELKTGYSDVSAEEKKWSADILQSTKGTESEVRDVISAQQQLVKHVANLYNQSHALEERLRTQNSGTASKMSNLANRIAHLEESQGQHDSALADEISKQAEEIKALRKELGDVRHQRKEDLQKMHVERTRQQEQEQQVEVKEQQEEANAEQLNATIHRQEMDFAKMQKQQMQQQDGEEVEQQVQQKDTNPKQSQDTSDVIDVDVTVGQQDQQSAAQPQKAESQASLHDGLTEEESAGIDAARQLLKGQLEVAQKPMQKLSKSAATKSKGSKRKAEDDVLRLADNAIAQADEELADVVPEVHVTSSASAKGSGPSSVKVSKRVQDKASRLRELWARKHQKPHHNMAQKMSSRQRILASASHGGFKVNELPSWAVREPSWLKEDAV